MTYARILERVITITAGINIGVALAEGLDGNWGRVSINIIVAISCLCMANIVRRTAIEHRPDAIERWVANERRPDANTQRRTN